MSFRISRIQTRVVEHMFHKNLLKLYGGKLRGGVRHLWVTVHAKNGCRGHGEGAVTLTWSGEKPEIAQWIVDHLFAPRLVGPTFDHPREALAIMDTTLYGNPFVKGAVDTAIWDLWSRLQNVSAAEFFRNRKPAASIPTRAALVPGSVAQTIRMARAFWKQGIRTLKFKIGSPPFGDVARLRAVRDELGNEPVFTLDANCAYPTADKAVAAIEALMPFGIALVEQPTPRDRIRMMAEVRRRVDIPVMADESVFSPDQLAEALDCDAIDIVALSPGKNGGFTHSVDMADTLLKAGKACSLGCNLETDLGQASMACLAANHSSFPIEQIACDLPAATLFQHSAITSPIAFHDGRVGVPQGAGFGVNPAVGTSSDLISGEACSA